MFDSFIHEQEKSTSQQRNVSRLSEYKKQILSQPVNPTNITAHTLETYALTHTIHFMFRNVYYITNLLFGSDATFYVCDKCGLKLLDTEVFHRKGKIYCVKCVTSGKKNLFGGLLEKLGNKIETKMGHHSKSLSKIFT
jgi:hypothetical protein